jgi:uncharacterized membrane protein
MMSQNRAQIKDRLRAEQDFQVSLKSELMLQQLHERLDEMQTPDTKNKMGEKKKRASSR